MKAKQILSFKDLVNDKHEFLDKILENCNIDESTGRLYCKKCKNLVHVDWSRNLAFCGVHVISSRGVTYKEVPCDIYL